MILLLIITIALGIIVYVVGGLIFVDTSKAVLALSTSTVFAGFMAYKIYRGVNTLPDGGYYIDDKGDSK